MQTSHRQHALFLSLCTLPLYLYIDRLFIYNRYITAYIYLYSGERIKNEIIIAERKIVSQAVYGLIVFLPKEYCQAHGWNAGDTVQIKTDGKRIILEKKEPPGGEQNNYYMTKSDSEKEFEYQQSDLEKLLNLKLEKVDEHEAGADYRTTDNKFGIELSVVSFREDEEKILTEMGENEFKYIKDNNVIYADKIANKIDPKLTKILFISYINNKNKIKNKIEKEMDHFSKSSFNFEHALIVLNCKYFMYESLFSDCKDVLRDIGLSHQSLIGVVIVYLKNTKDDRKSLTPSVLIKNPHCSYQPFQITENFETNFESKPTRIHFELRKKIKSFDASELIDKIKKFMVKNKYLDENINITVHGYGINKPSNITLNNKEIPYKKFEKPI